jgi:malate dehydrogenase (oxaloacetate-decarboxylating)(NADP+)
MDGADVFIGLSVAGAATKEMVRSMAKNPIIFAMANPTPEILPEDIKAVRDDAIIGLSQSGEQRPRLSLHFPWRARRARAHDQ